MNEHHTWLHAHVWLHIYWNDITCWLSWKGLHVVSLISGYLFMLMSFLILASCKVGIMWILYVDIVLWILARGYYMKDMIIACSEEGSGLNRRWSKGRIIRGITYQRKGPGWTGGDRMGDYILCWSCMLIWLR